MARQKLQRPKYSNCLIWVIVQWLLYGGSIEVIRHGSKPFNLIWLPHFKWHKDGKVYGYYPSKEACRGKRLNTHLLFHGVPLDITKASKGKG